MMFHSLSDSHHLGYCLLIISPVTSCFSFFPFLSSPVSFPFASWLFLFFCYVSSPISFPMSFSFSCLLIPFPVSYSVSSAISASVSSPISCSFLHYFLLFPVSFLVWYELTSAGLDVRAGIFPSLCAKCKWTGRRPADAQPRHHPTGCGGAVFDGWMRRSVSGVGSFVWSDILLFHWQLLQFDRDHTRDLFQSCQVLDSSSGRRKRRRVSSPTPAADGGYASGREEKRESLSEIPEEARE